MCYSFKPRILSVKINGAYSKITLQKNIYIYGNKPNINFRLAIKYNMKRFLKNVTYINKRKINFKKEKKLYYPINKHKGIQLKIFPFNSSTRVDRY